MAGSPIKHERNRVWREAIMIALKKQAGGDADVVQALVPIAEKLISEANAGNIAHTKELGDRLDGKAAQQVIVTGDSDSPLETKMEVRLVRSHPQEPPEGADAAS